MWQRWSGENRNIHRSASTCRGSQSVSWSGRAICGHTALCKSPEITESPDGSKTCEAFFFCHSSWNCLISQLMYILWLFQRQYSFLYEAVLQAIEFKDTNLQSSSFNDVSASWFQASSSDMDICTNSADFYPLQKPKMNRFCFLIWQAHPDGSPSRIEHQYQLMKALTPIIPDDWYSCDTSDSSEMEKNRDSRVLPCE